MGKLAFAMIVALAGPLTADVSPTAAAAASPAPTAVVTFAVVKGVNTDKSIAVEAAYAAWPHISLEEAQRLHKMKGVVFADARAKVEWDQSHVPGAIPVPLGEFDAYYAKNAKKFKTAKYIVVYCHGVGCHLSDMACKHFHEKGHRNVVNFYSGWPAWSGAALPTQNSAGVITNPAAVTASAGAK